MKKPPYYLVSLLFFLILSTQSQAIEKKKGNKYEDWLKKEVKLIISSEEEKKFEALKTDKEKDAFIELFWAMRDPSPQTKENEFKEEWYKRLEYVNKNFNYGPQRKIDSDMGKVYMLLGPPSQSKGMAGGRRASSIGGSQLEVPPQIWIYHAMPDLGLIVPFRVTFRQYQYGYDLDYQTPQNILRAMEIFPKVVQYNADLKELPKFKFNLDDNSFEGKLINDFISSGETNEQIYFEWMPHFSQALNESTYIYFLFQIDSKKSNIKKGEEIIFFGRLEGENGWKEDFLKQVKQEEISGGQCLASFGVPAHADKYTLYLGVRSKDTEKQTLVKASLNVPDFLTDELTTSTLILSPKVLQIKKTGKEKEEFNPYVFGQVKITPLFNTVFRTDESLNVFFQIYNAKLANGETSLQVEYFIVAPEGTYRLNAQEIVQKVEEGQAISGGTEVPLSPLKPGKYTFKIKIIDKNAIKTIEKTADFILK